MCIVLREPCNTLEQLCKGGPCTYAIFNDPSTNKDKCCPVRTWAPYDF